MSGGEFKGWVPTAYLDEVSPAPRETPEDWLFHGDVLRLAPAEADEGEPPGEPVVDGLLVSFHGLTDLDPIEVTWRGPGDHTIHGDVPPEATHFWLPFDPDTIARRPSKRFSLRMAGTVCSSRASASTCSATPGPRRLSSTARTGSRPS